MKKYKLSKNMLEFYSVNDLKKYLNKPRKVGLKLTKKEAIEIRIEQVKKENEIFLQELQNSSLFRLAGLLMVSQPNLIKIFNLSYKKTGRKKPKINKSFLTNVEYTKEVKAYIKKMKIIPYVKIVNEYIINDPIIFDLMLAIVKEAHEKDLHDLINDKGLSNGKIK